MLLYLFLTALTLLLTKWHFERKKRFQILSNYGYNVPPTNYIAGNLHQIARDDLATMEDWMERYGEEIGEKGGKIMGWYRGPNPALWTTSPELLKEVFIKDAETFIDRPMLDRSDNIPHLINMKGKEWKRARSTLAPTFTAAKLKKMSGIMGTTVKTMLELLEHKIDEGGIIDCNEVFQRLTLDTIGQCALAMNVNCQRDQDDKFLKMVRASLDRQIDSTVIVASCFPLVENIIAWIFSKRGRKHTNQVIIEKCREVLHARIANPPSPPPVDALQLCIEAAGKEKMLSEDEIVAHEFIFILAGYETTAAALNFTSYLLAKNPDVQDKLQEEIDAHFPDVSLVCNYDNVSDLEYLDMVLCESMRVYPPIPLHIGRWASKERTICGKRIPQGTGVLAATWVLHHNPKFWPDPWRFDPERFAPENRDKIIEMTYMPFGEGPRNCIGRRFALMEAKMALVEFFRRYRLDICHKTPDPLPVRNKGLTLSVVGDELWLRAARR